MRARHYERGEVASNTRPTLARSGSLRRRRDGARVRVRRARRSTVRSWNASRWHWNGRTRRCSGGRRFVDVGCGGGARPSRRHPWASSGRGIDPAVTMARSGATRRRERGYCVGRAEALPFGPGSVDVMIAAGSLNFVDLAAFHDEARRVLEPHGVVVVYDFATGCSIADRTRRWQRRTRSSPVVGRDPWRIGVTWIPRPWARARSPSARTTRSWSKSRWTPTRTWAIC